MRTVFDRIGKNVPKVMKQECEIEKKTGFSWKIDFPPHSALAKRYRNRFRKRIIR